MTYATQEQLEDRYGAAMLRSLTDRATPPAGEIDADVLARALVDTDALIDGYLKVRYRLPIAETPPLVADLAQQIAIYKLHSTAVADKIKEDYKQALVTLKMIADGTVRLELPENGGEPAASGSSGVKIVDRPRDLTPENLKRVM